jgi:hypothetical protein
MFVTVLATSTTSYGYTLCIVLCFASIPSTEVPPERTLTYPFALRIVHFDGTYIYPSTVYECDNCDRSFGSQHALNRHLNSPVLVFECDDYD